MNQPNQFVYNFHTTRLGETVWINYRGEWTCAVVKRIGRKTVELAFHGHRIKREYRKLRKTRDGHNDES